MSADRPRIHVLFKTHLDLGFTDDAHAVIDGYLDSYLPQAIDLARRLRVEAPEDAFVWTVGSWLVHEALERLRGRARSGLELALAEGLVRWHALPFTTHTEYLDAGLVRHGLSLSRALDRRFGRTTRAAKMTDVPGHTGALLPLLAESGVELLHIGVNPASAVPQVPAWCRWRSCGAEVVLGYEGDYGGVGLLPGGGCGLAFGFTGDNHGPQDAGRVREFYRSLRARFPGHHVAATGFDGLLADLAGLRGRLPPLDGEIGDTWIHGTGSDPEKTRRFRALARWRSAVVAADPGQAERLEMRRFSTRLLLVGEHTWGRDTKRFPGDGPGVVNGSFDAQELRAERAAGRLDHLERSWQEQRAYLDEAVACLAGSPLHGQALAACAWPAEPGGAWSELAPGTAPSGRTAGWDFTAGDDGALTALVRRADGAVLASPERTMGALRYQVYGSEDYDAFLAAYNPRWEATRNWAGPDFGKPGLERVLARGRSFVPRLQRAWRRDDGALRLALAFPAEAATAFGCPRTWIVVVHEDGGRLCWDVRWSGKQATRVPEALWLRFNPPLARSDGLRLRKLGRDIDPRQVVAGGNRALHHCEQVAWGGPGPAWTLDLPDTGLVAPGGGALAAFRQDLPDPRDGIDLNLCNNTWGTNFPLWYQDNGVVRASLA